MKVFNIFFCLVFILFAALQYNDPDPYVWVPIYLYAAVLCWLAAKRNYNTKAYLFGIAVYSIYAVYLFFGNNGMLDWLTLHHAENIAGTMKAEKPWIEASREFLGLMILIFVLVVDYFVALKKYKTS